ncbi:MAG: hypothetical protein ACK5LK_10830 [Chthoniobacterales bacterium]
MILQRFAFSHSLARACLLVCAVGFVKTEQARSQEFGDLEQRIFRIDREKEAPGLSKKAFHPGDPEFTSKKFKANSFLDTKAFGSKSYEPKKFLGIPIPWTKDKAAIQNKTYETSKATFQQNTWDRADKKVADASESYTVKRATKVDNDSRYKNKKANTDGRTDGYWAAFRETATRDLSFEEVQKLINKGNGK